VAVNDEQRQASGAGRAAPGSPPPPYERTTGFGHWNRYAAVNDEFIDVHMSEEAARKAGQRAVFGMGNLRVGYLHNMLHDWIGPGGDIAAFSCQFRRLNFENDVLTCHGEVGDVTESGGITQIEMAIGVTNQAGEETTPGTARVVVFDGGQARMPAPSPEPPRSSTPEPGVFLDQATLDWIGRPLEPIVSLPVGANDIRRWAIATYYPDPVPDEYYREDVARCGPWGGLVATRDFNPFAWNIARRPDEYPWMRPMGDEPGFRGLNGGQDAQYFAPVRPGDTIASEITLVDAHEKEGRGGLMLFLVDQARWTNQRDELVRISRRTSIYR
jgi:acyl dehydratase